MNGVILTATGDLLRAGFCDFSTDGLFDNATESYRTDVPEPAVTRCETSAEFHRWTGAAWEVVSELALAKSNKIQVLDLAVRNYVYAHYEAHRQTTFSILMSEAIKHGFDNRYAYISSAFDWAQNGPIGYYYVKAYEINAQTTVADVKAVSWDLHAAFDASDPVVTIYQAITTIEFPIITSALTANGTEGSAFSYTVTGESGVRTPTSYDAEDVPDGLSVDTATGTISGTPTLDAVGTHNVTITATNSAGTDTETLVITIAAL